MNQAIVLDLTAHENDVEDQGTDLDWTVSGLDHAGASGAGSDDDVLTFTPDADYAGDDIISLILSDSEGAQTSQQITLSWSSPERFIYLPMVLKHALQALPAPTDLNGYGRSESTSCIVDLTWSDHALNESAYHIERAPSESGPWTEIISIAADSTSYMDTSVSCHTVYYYRVRAYRSQDGSFSDYSNVKWVKTPVIWIIGAQESEDQR